MFKSKESKVLPTPPRETTYTPNELDIAMQKELINRLNAALKTPAELNKTIGFVEGNIDEQTAPKVIAKLNEANQLKDTLAAEQTAKDTSAKPPLLRTRKTQKINRPIKTITPLLTSEHAAQSQTADDQLKRLLEEGKKMGGKRRNTRRRNKRHRNKRRNTKRHRTKRRKQGGDEYTPFRQTRKSFANITGWHHGFSKDSERRNEIKNTAKTLKGEERRDAAADELRRSTDFVKYRDIRENKPTRPVEDPTRKKDILKEFKRRGFNEKDIDELKKYANNPTE